MFTEIQTAKIIEAWGCDTYTKIQRYAEFYSAKWKLSDLRFFDSYSMNAIFFCTSEIYGESVLKISCGFQIDEFVWEYNILREYNGKRYAKVFAADEKVMLIERISPGTELKDEESLDVRLAVFSKVFNGMHIAPENAAMYKRYADGLADNINSVRDREDLHAHTLKVAEVLSSVTAVYNREMLLHGDLQYHNILKRDNGTYAVIDPQGRIADPVFDVPRYILIEYYNMPPSERAEKIEYIITNLEKSLNIPNEIIRQCFYIETVSFECWWASVGDYTIDNVIFAEKLLPMSF